MGKTVWALITGVLTLIGGYVMVTSWWFPQSNLSLSHFDIDAIVVIPRKGKQQYNDYEITYTLSKSRLVKIRDCQAFASSLGINDSGDSFRSTTFDLTTTDEHVDKIFKFKGRVALEEQSGTFSVKCAEGIRTPERPFTFPTGNT
jgi:hypothetical protein